MAEKTHPSLVQNEDECNINDINNTKNTRYKNVDVIWTK